MDSVRPFPFRPLLAGELRGLNEDSVREIAGEPDTRSGDVWVYRMGRDVPEGTLGDPRSVEVQLWFESRSLSHAWLRLVFADGLDYQEVLH
ncbi:MAG: hypothetical protein L0216_01385 [Planctomycetales bacterium]|nr:hypothetical protein [Planctomycetales bacterium]